MGFGLFKFAIKPSGIVIESNLCNQVLSDFQKSLGASEQIVPVLWAYVEWSQQRARAYGHRPRPALVRLIDQTFNAPLSHS